MSSLWYGSVFRTYMTNMNVELENEWNTYFAIGGLDVLAKYELFVVQVIIGIVFTECHELRLREITGSVEISMKVFI